MTRKPAKKSSTAKKGTAHAKLDDKALAKAKAVAALRPSFNAAAIVHVFTDNLWWLVDPVVVANELGRQCEAFKEGGTERAEAMLLAQAHSLDVLFPSLARRAGLNMGQYLPAAETYMKLALRLQNQCRATLETLAAIKNPPVVFAKQANIVQGPQQVNNGTAPLPARAENIELRPNELLEREHGERLDARTAGTTSASHPTMATMDVLDWAQNPTRQSTR